MLRVQAEEVVSPRVGDMLFRKGNDVCYLIVAIERRHQGNFLKDTWYHVHIYNLNFGFFDAYSGLDLDMEGRLVWTDPDRNQTLFGKTFEIVSLHP